MIDLAVFGPLLLSIGVLITLIQFEKSCPHIIRASCSALCIFLSARYVWWRFEYSMPVHQNIYQQAWARAFFVFEVMSIVSTTCGFFFMSRQRLRRPPQNLPLEFAEAPVDVFIATYNEPYEVLERTILGAMTIEHTDLRVWVLDDGARDWARDLAKELGAHYVRRVKGAHAKAGNVNNGLSRALGCGRRPEFILLLDADFVPFRNILKRTLGLFIEPDVGIVQTPQHFFNTDPIQNNLRCARQWPDEQRFFFDILLPSKDAWGAAFCCGTSAVFRVAALVEAGGMAIETVTEDMLTTFKVAEHGYRTIFLNERLSMGLAPESLSSFVSQRARWCLGAIQQIYTRWSFIGPAKISFVNRISSLDGVLYWMSSAPFKLMMILGPAVFWWTRTAVIASTISDLIYYLAPMVACSVAFMSFYARKRVIPVMTDVTQLLSSFAIISTVSVGLIKPWGHPFKVTAKGVSRGGTTVHWNLLLPFMVVALATIAGIVLNLFEYSPLYGTDGYEVNVFWSIYNIILLVIACAVCVERPQKRMGERFRSNERALVRLSTGMQAPCVVHDLSSSGAHVILGIGQLRSGDEGVLEFADGVEVPFRFVRNLAGGVALRFRDDSETRRKLIVKLFTGRYVNEVQKVKVTGVFAAVGRRLAA